MARHPDFVRFEAQPERENLVHACDDRERGLGDFRPDVVTGKNDDIHDRWRNGFGGSDYCTKRRQLVRGGDFALFITSWCHTPPSSQRTRDPGPAVDEHADAAFESAMYR